MERKPQTGKGGNHFERKFYYSKKNDALIDKDFNKVVELLAVALFII